MTERETDIGKLVERKLEEKLSEEREKIKEELKEDINESNSGSETKKGIDRRSFLKKLGAGAVGAGVIGLAPASGLKLTRNGVFQSGQKTGALTDSGNDTDIGDNYQLPNASDNIDLQNSGSIQNADNLNATTASISGVAGVITLEGSRQSIPSNSETKVAFDTISYEDSDIVTADTANSEIIIDEAGKYLISAGVLWLSGSWSTGDRCQIKITVNGSDLSPVYQRKIGTGRQSACTPSVYYEASSNDKIEVSLYQTSGSSEEIESSKNNTFLRVIKIG